MLPYEKNLIASELGITRESFSRGLASFERHGIRIDSQTIWIDDAEGLAKECIPDPLIDDHELGFFLGGDGLAGTPNTTCCDRTRAGPDSCCLLNGWRQ